MASNNAMTTALALPSSKTNWTAIVPARAPPPPPPVTQATMLKRTHEIQCGKCALSDYAENIGVWNDDGTLQELGLCGECEKPDIVGCCEKCDMEIVRDSDEHDNCLIIDGGDSADKFCCQSCEWEDEQTCDGCGTTCLDHTSNKGRGSESPCEECEETRCKLCPCACEENQLLEEFWDGGMKEMWGEELREGHPLWEPFKLYKAMKKEQDA